MIDLANYRLHHFHIQSFPFSSESTDGYWHDIPSLALISLKLDQIVDSLQLDERIIEEFQSIHFSEAGGKKSPRMLSMYFSIFPDHFSTLCLPIYLITFTQYHFWALHCARHTAQSERGKLTKHCNETREVFRNQFIKSLVNHSGLENNNFENPW